MKNYIIWTPSFAHKSAGVRALHLLAEELTKNGYEVFLYSGEPHSSKYKYISTITEEHKINSIVIYPEIVTGNPLQCQNVVRYVLNYPGKLAGTKTYHASEKIVTYLPEFYSGAPILAIPLVDQELFFDAKLPKKQDCYFVHKGGKWRDAPETEGLLEINTRYPESRVDLANLLRSTGILYSYDDLSTLLDEAVVCGAQVKIITQQGVRDYCSPISTIINSFPGQLNEFILMTQEMNYLGEIEVISSSLSTKKNASSKPYHICTINEHALGDVSMMLRDAIAELGHQAFYAPRIVVPEAINIFMDSSQISDWSIVPDDSILFNLEHLDVPSGMVNEQYLERLSRYQVWDYSKKNIEIIQRRSNKQVCYVPVGFAESQAKVKPVAEQDIDILFYGGESERQAKILGELKQFANVSVVTGIYGSALYDLIARAKIVVNIHYYEKTSLFESVRVSALLANKKAVVSEVNDHTEIPIFYKNAICGVPYESIVAACKSLLVNDVQRKILEGTGYGIFSAFRQSSFLPIPKIS